MHEGLWHSDCVTQLVFNFISDIYSYFFCFPLPFSIPPLHLEFHKWRQTDALPLIPWFWHLEDQKKQTYSSRNLSRLVLLSHPSWSDKLPLLSVWSFYISITDWHLTITEVLSSQIMNSIIQKTNNRKLSWLKAIICLFFLKFCCSHLGKTLITLKLVFFSLTIFFLWNAE